MKFPVQIILLDEKIEPLTFILYKDVGAVPKPTLQLIIPTSRDKYLLLKRILFSVIVPLQLILPVIIGLIFER